MPRRLTRIRPAPHPAPLLTRIGERGLIQRLGSLLPKAPPWVIAGAGADDTAIVDVGADALWLFTCDVQCEGTHFDRRWIDAAALGRRAAAVNLSDIAAMGGTPRVALVSLLLPPRLPVHDFDDLMRGLAAGFAAAGTPIVGGNLARADRLAIDVTVAGRVQRHRVVRRRGARAGDLVLVSGSPGDSAAGLALLQAGAGRRGSLPQRFLVPTARLHAGRFLAGAGVTAMIDVSDGISTDVLHLCDASGVDVEIDWRKLPVTPALDRAGRRLRRDPRDWVLHGGEAYELLCTLPAARLATLRRRAAERLPGLPFWVIGRILPRGSGRWLARDGERQPLRQRAFEHFAAGPRRPRLRSRPRPGRRRAS